MYKSVYEWQKQSQGIVANTKHYCITNPLTNVTIRSISNHKHQFCAHHTEQRHYHWRTITALSHGPHNLPHRVLTAQHWDSPSCHLTVDTQRSVETKAVETYCCPAMPMTVSFTHIGLKIKKLPDQSNKQYAPSTLTHANKATNSMPSRHLHMQIKQQTVCPSTLAHELKQQTVCPLDTHTWK